MLKQHNKRDDAWAAFNGKVYNITPYLSFHPGGEKELMRVAGRDGTKLFGESALVVFNYGLSFLRLDACMGQRGLYACSVFGWLPGPGAVAIIMT